LQADFGVVFDQPRNRFAGLALVGLGLVAAACGQIVLQRVAFLQHVTPVRHVT
jgi:hypothetical protein